MHDKYSILISYPLSLSDKQIDNFFENWIINDKAIYIPIYVLESIKKINISQKVMYDTDSVIIQNFNMYFKKIKNNLKIMIKSGKNKSIINSIINILKDLNHFIFKLKPFFSKNIGDKIVEFMLSTLLCDPMLKDIYEKEFLDLSNFSQIKFFITKIKNFDIFSSWFLPFLKKSLKVKFDNSIDQLFLNNLNNRIAAIYKFNKIIKFFTEYHNHLNYINERNLFDFIFDYLINKVIYDISDNNTIESLNKFLIQNHKSITYIGKFFDKEEKRIFEANIVVNTDKNIDENNTLLSICEFYITLKKYYFDTFTTICNLFCQKISELISKRDLYFNFSELIFEKIKSNYVNVNSDLIYIIEIVQNLPNKNIVFKNYHKHQMQRLLGFFSTLESSINDDQISLEKKYLDDDLFDSKYILNSYRGSVYGLDKKMIVSKFISSERNNNKFLSKCFDNSQRFLLANSVNDIENSVIFKHELKNIKCNSNILISSNGVWDVNTINNPINVDTKETLQLRSNNGMNVDLFSSALFMITNKYEIKNCQNKETLYWHLNVGFIELDYTINDNVCNLKLLPIQLVILERFEDEEYLLFDELILSCVINKLDKKDIYYYLDTLIDSKLLIFSDNKYYLNKNFNSDLDLTNKISMKKYNELKNLEAIELAHDISDILKSNINSIVKTKSTSINECYKICKERLSFLIDFEFDIKDNKIFKDTINELIKKDYLKIDLEADLQSENETIRENNLEPDLQSENDTITESFENIKWERYLITTVLNDNLSNLSQWDDIFCTNVDKLSLSKLLF